MYRSRSCGELRKKDLETKVVLAGWVHRRRDHGGLIFIDLRDRSGLIQIVFGNEDKALHALAESLRSEFVISVEGLVVGRSVEATNAKIPTGEIEVKASKLEILNKSKTPIIEIADPTTEPDENVSIM